MRVGALTPRYRGAEVPRRRPHNRGDGGGGATLGWCSSGHRRPG